MLGPQPVLDKKKNHSSSKAPKMQATITCSLALFFSCSLLNVEAFSLIFGGCSSHRNIFHGKLYGYAPTSIPHERCLPVAGRQSSVHGILYSRRHLRVHAVKMLQQTTSVKKGLSWIEIGSILPPEPPRPATKLTLFRDTNGWCPFCERVWIALEYKKIDYDTVKINLMNKPQWFKELVPTALVPAIELHSDKWNPEVRGSGRVMWESMDILKALDELFPETPHLRAADRETEERALSAVSDFQAAGYRFVYDGRRSPEPSAAAARLANLTVAIEHLEATLRSSGGPFFCGRTLSIADCAAAPFLERYRHQLPLISADAPRLYSPAERPALAAWYDAMDAEPAFARRACGDPYSWAAVLSAMARFGLPAGSEPPPERRAEAERADKAAATILDGLAAGAVAGLAAATAGARHDAVRAVAANREAVVEDAVRAAPLSQAHVPRLPFSPAARRAADAALRAAAQVLLTSGTREEDARAAVAAAAAALRAEDVDVDLAAAAGRLVAARLCVPRDMGAAAAAALRSALLGVAAALGSAA